MCLIQHKESSKVLEHSQKYIFPGFPQPGEKLCPWTRPRCQQMSLVLITGLSAASPRAPLRPVHPEDGTKHAQVHGKLQKHQNPEVQAVQKRQEAI